MVLRREELLDVVHELVVVRVDEAEVDGGLDELPHLVVGDGLLRDRGLGRGLLGRRRRRGGRATLAASVRVGPRHAHRARPVAAGVYVCNHAIQ